MSKNYFEDEKLKYENIEIPEELDFRVKKALRDGKKYIVKKAIYNVGKTVAALSIIFATSVNVSATVYDFFSTIPGFKELAQLVKINGGDDGFDNAVESGLVQDIGYSAIQEGISFKVNSISGDYRNFWVNYELVDKEKYTIYLELEDGSISWSSEAGLSDGDKDYFSLSLDKFIENVTMNFKIYKKSNEKLDDKDYITTFKVPIILNSEFNVKEKIVNIVPIKVDTSVGTISFEKMVTSKTRTNLYYKIDSEEYKHIGFENGRIIDSNGKEYKTDSSYISNDGGEYFAIEFRGEIPLDKSLTFQYDSLYLQTKEDKVIKINTSEKIIENNFYDFKIEDINGYFIKLTNENLLRCGILNSKSEDGFSVYSSVKEENKPLEVTVDNTGKDIIEINVYDISIKEGNKIKLNIKE